VNQKIKKVNDEIERTKAKIAELQALLPELERKRIDMENTEIIKLVRSADISAAELPTFLESLKAPKEHSPTHVAQPAPARPVMVENNGDECDLPPSSEE